MAKKTIAKYFSDVSGEEIDSDQPTVTFAYDGTTYEIDLTPDEHRALAEALAPYVGLGRKISGGPRRARVSASVGPSPKDVRAWAQSHGIDVPSRGRIPATVTEAYDSAH